MRGTFIFIAAKHVYEQCFNNCKVIIFCLLFGMRANDFGMFFFS